MARSFIVYINICWTIDVVEDGEGELVWKVYALGSGDEGRWGGWVVGGA